MKIITFYLPQFHNIPENDEWWGDGFTEWVNVKNAKSLYEGHIQPKVPLNNNYYNLLDDDAKAWQIELAKKYGVYGFCYYHYWFNGKLLLEKPMEQMLENKELDLPFCISWANEAWTKAWTGESEVTLLPQKYGGEKEWKEHFDYLLPFFKDSRYITYDGKPLFIIYKPELIECCNEMLDYFKKLAVESGLKGLGIAYQHGNMDFYVKSKDDSRFDLNIEFEPVYARHDLAVGKRQSILRRTVRNVYNKLSIFWGKSFGKELRWQFKIGKKENNEVLKFNYDQIWDIILRRKVVDGKRVPGGFAKWDNTPRHGQKGHVYEGASPEKFQKYLTQLIKKAKEEYKKDMIFIYAWNEWAEGGYLEPDEENGYGYLEAIKNALEENNEFPVYDR